LVIVTAAVALLAILAGIALAVAWPGGDEAVVVDDAEVKELLEEASGVAVEETETSVEPTPTQSAEIPDLVGRNVGEAEMVLTIAGFAPVLVETDAADGHTPGTVISVEPGAGSILQHGTEVQVTYIAAAAVTEAPGNRYVVCIDPGHQAQANLAPEPIGPGAAETKEKVRGGTSGAVTGVPEYQTMLEVGLKLREALEARGVEVVMTRTTNDVDISNAERAEIANQAGADLFVRVHADGSNDSSVSGVSTLYAAGNAWVAPIEERSRLAAEDVQSALSARTGAASRGTVPRSDITGFNWSRVPAVLVECGFMSNPEEDRLLNTADYQLKVTEGIADGVITYLER
jgi:N-acetylmuramoyl-L-alanine amidase